MFFRLHLEIWQMKIKHHKVIKISFITEMFASSSPKLTMSTFTFSFLRRLLNLTSSLWSATTGLATNIIILGL
jgi:hypothetical protein